MRVTLSTVPFRQRLWISGILLFSALAAAALLLHPAWEFYLQSRPASCLMKLCTGVPCLACRGTRAALALAHGDLGMALCYNPLATAFLAVLGSYLILLSVTGKRCDFHLSRPETVLFWTLLAFALLGNWIYVIREGG